MPKLNNKDNYMKMKDLSWDSFSENVNETSFEHTNKFENVQLLDETHVNSIPKNMHTESNNVLTQEKKLLINNDYEYNVLLISVLTEDEEKYEINSKNEINRDFSMPFKDPLNITDTFLDSLTQYMMNNCDSNKPFSIKEEYNKEINKQIDKKLNEEYNKAILFKLYDAWTTGNEELECAEDAETLNRLLNEIKTKGTNVKFEPQDVIKALNERTASQKEINIDNKKQQEIRQIVLDNFKTEDLWLQAVHNGINTKHTLYLENSENNPNNYRFGFVVNLFDIDSFDLSRLIDERLNSSTDKDNFWKDFPDRDRQYEQILSALLKYGLNVNNLITKYRKYNYETFSNNDEYQSLNSKRQEFEDSISKVKKDIRDKDDEISNVENMINNTTGLKSKLTCFSQDFAIWTASVTGILFVPTAITVAIGIAPVVLFAFVLGIGFGLAAIGGVTYLISKSSDAKSLAAKQESLQQSKNKLQADKVKLEQKKSDLETEQNTYILRLWDIRLSGFIKNDVYPSKVMGLVQNYMSTLFCKASSKFLTNATDAVHFTGKISFSAYARSNNDKIILPNIDPNEENTVNKFFKIIVNKEKGEYITPCQIVTDYVIDKKELAERDIKIESAKDKKYDSSSKESKNEKEILSPNSIKLDEGQRKEISYNDLMTKNTDKNRINSQPFEVEQTTNAMQRSKK